MITNLLITETNSLLWKRLVAFVLDFLLVAVGTLAVVILLPQSINGPAVIRWVFLGTFVAYSILFDYYRHGTPGKQIMRIKILYAYDKRSYLLTTFYRAFLKTIFFSTSFWMLGAPYRQGFHNRVARCRIVENAAN
jgi:uncharacterized RDD family membrane protein YckC